MNKVYCKIYKIVDNTNGNIYYGSTKQRLLSKRIGRHREATNTCSSKIIIKNNDYFYELVEKCNLDNIKERERYYINSTDKCINRNKLNGYNKERQRLYSQKYYKNKKEITKRLGGLNLIDTNIFS
tara:strand:- start:518 stop:895 length:378 start_codon:yes stop_codon:yes gene_type:complete